MVSHSFYVRRLWLRRSISPHKNSLSPTSFSEQQELDPGQHCGEPSPLFVVTIEIADVVPDVRRNLRFGYD